MLLYAIECVCYYVVLSACANHCCAEHHCDKCSVLMNVNYCGKCGLLCVIECGNCCCVLILCYVDTIALNALYFTLNGVVVCYCLLLSVVCMLVCVFSFNSVTKY